MRWSWALGLVATVAAATPANAGVEAWQVSEILASDRGSAEVRFVELFAPPSPTADNCFFSTTRLEVLAADGSLLGAVTPFPSTACFPGGTYFLFATPEATGRFGVARDAPLVVPLPGAGGQVCLRSSATRYDCARWGAVSAPVVDIGDPGDTSAAVALVDGRSLARTRTTGVVADDFTLATPTPRQPNDGSAWFPPDAGPPPDADVAPDAEVADAEVFPDARPRPRADAWEDPAWLAAAPGGGVTCTCRVQAGAGRAGVGWLAALTAGLGFQAIRRRRT